MENEKKRGGAAVRGRAEGIERWLFVERTKGGLMAAERFKVAALVAGVMCLCNADSVVMSVAIVPLAAKHSWSSAFLGIVQVHFFVFNSLGKLRFYSFLEYVWKFAFGFLCSY